MTNLKLASRVGVTVVVVGDSRTGKSALIKRFVTEQFVEQYSPTSFDKSFATREVEKHQVDFSFWDTSGSPAYDSVRPLSYQEADAFLLCYKISDPISLHNVRSKWMVEIRRHHSSAPVILCGCQADLRNDALTLAHLSRTGRTPVSREQALAICCEIGADHYVETSARRDAGPELRDSPVEAIELCASAAIRHRTKNKSRRQQQQQQQQQQQELQLQQQRQQERRFERGPLIHSSLFLFDNPNSITSSSSFCNIAFVRSPSSAHSSLSLQQPQQPPVSTNQCQLPTLAFKRSSAASVTSLKSPSDPSMSGEVRLLRTFSPEPCKAPSLMSEHDEAYQKQAFRPFSPSPQSQLTPQRPVSLCEPLSRASDEASEPAKLKRPTTLFKESGNSFGAWNQQYQRRRAPFPCRGASLVSPGTESLFSLSEASSGVSGCINNNSLIKSPQLDVVWPTNAQVRPNGLSRRTSYRTHPKMAIPVSTPMSPVSSEVSFDLKQQLNSPTELSSIAETSCGENSTKQIISVAVFEPKSYESLKSQVSTCSSSESSSEDSSSKLPSEFSDASSISFVNNNNGRQEEAEKRNEKDVLENFISPKSGVYRPSTGKKGRNNCAIM